MFAPRRAHITPLLFKAALAGSLITGPVQGAAFNLHDVGQSYQKDHFSPITSASPIRSGREDMLRIPPGRELQLVGPRRWAFSLMVQAILPPSQVSLVPSLLSFWKSLKTWLCQIFSTRQHKTQNCKSIVSLS